MHRFDGEKEMTMIKCKDCGNSVSKAAKTCHYCGAPIKGRATRAITLMAVIVTLWVLGRNLL